MHTKVGYRVSSLPSRRTFRITINRPRRWHYWYNGERLKAPLARQLDWTHTSRCNPAPFAYADFSVRLDPCTQFALTRRHGVIRPLVEPGDDGVKHPLFLFPCCFPHFVFLAPLSSSLSFSLPPYWYGLLRVRCFDRCRLVGRTVRC